jgi:hypothetical protein
VHEQLALYAQESEANRNSRGVRRLSVYLGLAVLLAAASLMAVNNRGGAASKLPRVLVPRSSAGCAGLFNGSDAYVQMTVCISREGMINQIQYPDTAQGHTQIAFDGYCMMDAEFSQYIDYSPGSGVVSSGWGPATLTGPTGANNEIYNMTRNTSDGHFRLTEFIKVNLQVRSVFVGMTVKNLDSRAHTFIINRETAPAIDGSAADDQYNEFGRTASGIGATGQAFQGGTVGSNSLLFGATQTNAVVQTEPVVNFRAAQGCGSAAPDPPGPVTGGNRVFNGHLDTGFRLEPGVQTSVGKFVYRML